MKINSENLWEYINELATNEKVKLNVYYDNEYVTQIYWNGNSFEWEPGRFTSEAFFNPLYDFIVVEQVKKIPEKLEILTFSDLIDMPKEKLIEVIKEQRFKINSIIDYLKSKGDE